MFRDLGRAQLGIYSDFVTHGEDPQCASGLVSAMVDRKLGFMCSSPIPPNWLSPETDLGSWASVLLPLLSEECILEGRKWPSRCRTWSGHWKLWLCCVVCCTVPLLSSPDSQGRGPHHHGVGLQVQLWDCSDQPYLLISHPLPLLFPHDAQSQFLSLLWTTAVTLNKLIQHSVE